MAMESAIAFPRPVVEKKPRPIPSEQKPGIVDTARDNAQQLAKHAGKEVTQKLEDVRTQISEAVAKKMGLERSMAIAGINQANVLEAVYRSGGGTTSELVSFMQKHMGLKGVDPKEAFRKTRAVAAGLSDSTKGQNREDKFLKINLSREGGARFVAKDKSRIREWLKQQRSKGSQPLQPSIPR